MRRDAPDDICGEDDPSIEELLGDAPDPTAGKIAAAQAFVEAGTRGGRQPPEMLAAALQAYADGKRYSGIMQPIAIDLTPEARLALASYYSGLSIPAAPRSDEAAPELIERGRSLATKGDPGAQIPQPARLPRPALQSLTELAVLAGADPPTRSGPQKERPETT